MSGRSRTFADRQARIEPEHLPARQPIVWIHGDNLSPQSPALQTCPDAPALWVWDDARLDEWRISLKRLVFIYTCLQELPVQTRPTRTDPSGAAATASVMDVILRFAPEQNAKSVGTNASPSP